MASRTDPRLILLLEIVDQAFGSRNWNGVTLRGSLIGLTARRALWRPAAGRNCVWDLVLHCAWWKHEVRRRITRGDGVEGFARGPANFPALPAAPTEAAWKADIRLLVAEHRALRSAVAHLDPKLLGKARGSWRYTKEIHGIAEHDVYHTGQIQLVKRLMR